MTEGQVKRQSLIDATKSVATKSKNPDNIRGSFRQDTLLMGQSGIGKTHWTMKSLDEENVNFIKLRGSVNFLFLCASLMLAHYHHTKTRKNKYEKLVVVIDDCDSLFSDDIGLNALKEMTEKNGPERKISYNRIIQEHQLEQEHLDILDNYRPKNGGSGFSVDCNDMIFIVCTNFTVPTDVDAKRIAEKYPATKKANRYNSLAAVRRRFDPYEFFLDETTNFGLLAYVAIHDETFIPKGITKKMYEKHIVEILLWIKNNWNHLTDRNLDMIVDMCYMIIEHPFDYNDFWDSKFTKSPVLSSVMQRL